MDTELLLYFLLVLMHFNAVQWHETRTKVLHISFRRTFLSNMLIAYRIKLNVNFMSSKRKKVYGDQPHLIDTILKINKCYF